MTEVHTLPVQHKALTERLEHPKPGDWFEVPTRGVICFDGFGWFEKPAREPRRRFIPERERSYADGPLAQFRSVPHGGPERTERQRFLRWLREGARFVSGEAERTEARVRDERSRCGLLDCAGSVWDGGERLTYPWGCVDVKRNSAGGYNLLFEVGGDPGVTWQIPVRHYTPDSVADLFVAIRLGAESSAEVRKLVVEASHAGFAGLGVVE